MSWCRPAAGWWPGSGANAPYSRSRPATAPRRSSSAHALVQRIRELPARQRIVIALRYFEDMSDADIAALMGCSRGTVRSQAARALVRLRADADLVNGATPEPSRSEQ